MEDGANLERSIEVYAKLRGLLNSLPPETCGKVMAFLEQLHSTGQRFPGYDMIVSELAVIKASHPAQMRRTGPLQRQFFSPLEAFLIDEVLPEKRIGRIERASLRPIWNWISRDVLGEAMNDFELKGDLAGLIEAVMPTLRETVGAPQDLALRRTIAQMGGARVFEDLRDMVVVLQNQEALKTVSDRIVGPIGQVDEHHARFMTAALTPFARVNSPLTPYAVAMMLPKLSVPWQIIRVAIFACESDSGPQIAQTPYRAVIELMLADIERLMIRAEQARSSHNDELLATATGDFAVYVKTLLTEIELLPEQLWSRRLSALRARMARLLAPDLEGLPGRIRALLRARPIEHSGRKAAIDEHERASIEAYLNILMVARSSASELALNEVTMRVFNEVQAYLDAGLPPLIEGVRGLGGEDRAHRLLQLDAAVKVAYRVRGPVFATLLAKSIDVASNEKRPIARSA